MGERNSDPQRAGLLVGHDVYSNKPIWLPKESTVLVLAPPRSGKTTGTVAPAVVDHHGPVVATGVRRDIMMLTHPWRSHTGGPMWLCEPTTADTDLPAGVRPVRWSPVAGCQSLLNAKLRAEALFAVVDKGGANDQFWRNAGATLLSAYLMAAAHRGGSIADVLGWADRDSDRSPAEVLRAAADGVADQVERDAVHAVAGQVEAAIEQDPRYKAGVTGQVLQALEPFRLPEIRRMCNIPLGESFDPHQFLRESGTIWMLGSVSHQQQAAGVCTALTAAIVEAARDLAMVPGRLRPPLLLALDEAVNVAPIPRLEQLLSTGGGSGIQTIVVLQSLAAARNAWGAEMGDALLDFNNAKIVLGGLSDAQDLVDISALLGQREERVVQASRSGRLGVLDAGDYSVSWRQVPVMRPDEIRRIDSERRHLALLIARSGSGILLKQPRIYERRTPTPDRRGGGMSTDDHAWDDGHDDDADWRRRGWHGDVRAPRPRRRPVQRHSCWQRPGSGRRTVGSGPGVRASRRLVAVRPCWRCCRTVAVASPPGVARRRGGGVVGRYRGVGGLGDRDVPAHQVVAAVLATPPRPRRGSPSAVAVVVRRLDERRGTHRPDRVPRPARLRARPDRNPLADPLFTASDHAEPTRRPCLAARHRPVTTRFWSNPDCEPDADLPDAGLLDSGRPGR